MNVLVLNYYSRNSLAVVHALAGGHRLFGADAGARRGDGRWWESVLRHPSVESIDRYTSPEDSEAFLADLERICHSRQVDAIVPTGTTATNGLSRIKPTVESRTGARCAVTDFECLQRLTDKWYAFQLARDAGVPVPDTRLLDWSADLHTQVAGMRFPVVVKPRISYAAIGVRHIHSMEDLLTLQEKMPERSGYEGGECPLIVQELIEGDLHDVAAFACRGWAVARVSQRRVVSLYDFGGGGIVNLTTFDPQLREYARLLLQYAGWDGPMLFDFIRRSDGEFFLLECNPKIWGTTDLTLDAGVDVVSMMLDLFVSGKEPAEEADYEVGILYRWWFPECVYHWCHWPLGARRLACRVRRTFAHHGAVRVQSNLRLGDFGHLGGIAVNHLTS